MDLEILQIIWFILIAVLWTGYFFLEGFDFGVGIIYRFIAKDDQDRRVGINTIGPVWDGNEVWLLTAGGATFAAFPKWYATLFTTFYLPLFIILIALIYRGVAFDYRHKIDNPKWRELWDWGIFIGSFLPALLWGVAFANLLRGLKIEGGEYVGNFFDLLSPYALLGGVMTLTLFILHGSVFMALKTRGDMSVNARKLATTISLPATIIMSAFFVWTFVAEHHHFGRYSTAMAVLPLLAIALVGTAGWAVSKRYDLVAFLLTGSGIVVWSATIFASMFPNTMTSSIADAESLTIFTTSSTQATLTLMTIVAVLLVPVVLAYQGWTYWVFRQRIDRSTITGATKTPIDALDKFFPKKES